MEELKNFKKNEPLAQYTTFKIGGPAKYFCEANSIEELIRAVQTAQEDNLLYFVLGGGSNVLISDQGFDGLAIRFKGNKYQVQDCNIRAEAGVNLTELVNIAGEYSLTGLEFAAGIPGTFGGAIRGNAGAWGKCMADIMERVKVYRDGQDIDLSKEELGFSYRHSNIKDSADIILEGEIKLVKGDKEAIQTKVQKNVKNRKKHQDMEHNSAGCIFKNMKTDMTDKQLEERHIHLDKVTKDRKIPAGYLIERLDLKSFKVGGAQVSEKHANFIINTGKAKAEDVVILMSIIEQKVRNKFGVQLEKEVELVGF